VSSLNNPDRSVNARVKNVPIDPHVPALFCTILRAIATKLSSSNQGMLLFLR